MRDFAQVLNDGEIDIGITQHSLKALNVDEHGLDDMDNRILLTIIEKFKGGPVGITTIATAVGEEAGTLEEVYEPFLIQEGFFNEHQEEGKLLQKPMSIWEKYQPGKTRNTVFAETKNGYGLRSIKRILIPICISFI